MRRVFFVAAVLPAFSLGWLLWMASCERDNYRNELPLRSYDAAPKDLVTVPPKDAATPDLRTPVDMAAAPDMATSDMDPAPDMGRDM